MDIFNIKGFVTQFGATTVIIASIICIVDFLLNKFLKDKLNSQIINIIPIVLAIILELSYDMIFISHRFAITESGLCAGILAYSLSTIINVMISKLKKGENITADLVTLLIEGLLDGYVKENQKSAIALAVASILQEKDLEDTQKKELIKQKILEKKLSSKVKDSEITLLVDSIIIQTNNIEEKTNKLN